MKRRIFVQMLLGLAAAPLIPVTSTESGVNEVHVTSSVCYSGAAWMRDDTAWLQAAINDAYARGEQSVYIAPGVFRVTPLRLICA